MSFTHEMMGEDDFRQFVEYQDLYNAVKICPSLNHLFNGPLITEKEVNRRWRVARKRALIRTPKTNHFIDAVKTVEKLGYSTDKRSGQKAVAYLMRIPLKSAQDLISPPETEIDEEDFEDEDFEDVLGDL